MLLLATDQGMFDFQAPTGQATPWGLQGLELRSLALIPQSGRLIAAGPAGLFLQDDGWKRVLDGITHSVAAGPDGALYAGLRGVHLWTSRNAGQSWTEIPSAHSSMGSPGVPEPHIPGHPLDVLAIQAPTPFRRYLGIEAGGVLRSDDGGAAWRPASRGLHPDIHGLAVDPANPQVVHAATGHGLYRTEDAGESWERSDAGIDRPYLNTVFVLPNNPQILLAGGAPDSPRHYRRPGGARAAVFRSTDGGRTWTRVTQGLPDMLGGEVGCFVCSPAEPETIVAGTLAGDIFVSRDAGETWEQVAIGLPGIWAGIWTHAS